MKFYNNPLQEAGEVAQGMFNKVLIVFLAVSSVVASVLSTINIVFRIPDFFRFEFDRIEISRELDLGISGTDLGSFFSKFMLHSNEEFSLVSEHEGIKRELFNEVEAGMMDNFRFLLDVMLIVAIITLVLTVACIVLLYFRSQPRGLRRSLNIGLIFYVVVMAGLIVYFNVYDGDAVLMGLMMEGSFKADDLLQQMFDGRLTLDATVAITVISFIIMMIIRYIVWRMTAQKGIFSEALKGIAK